MIDKKDPRQDHPRADSSDEDLIIDLTDEVIIKTDEQEDIIELEDDLADDARGTDNKVTLSEGDEGLTAREETSKTDTQEDDVIFELDDQFADDETDMEEDDLIASAIKESLGTEEDETYESVDDFDLKASNDDVIILDNEQDVVDESLTAATEDDTSGAARDEDVFDLEEEIELEYELDEDEDELLALDDERSEDNEDFVSMVLGESSASKHSDDSEEPAEYLEFDSDRQDDIIDMDDGGDATPQITAPADAEALDDIDSGDLPDIEDVTELDFEDDDDEDEQADNVITLTGEETYSGDNIIARAMERSLSPDDESRRFQTAEEAEFESEDDDDDDRIAHNVPRQEDEAIVALKHPEQLDFENEEDLLADLNGVTELEDEDEIIPLNGSDNFDAENEEDIVEITEFDQHFPDDSEKILQQAGILDTTDEQEDDFLELIDVEEDRQSEDEEIIGIGESDAKSEYAELDNLFSDALEEDELEHEAAGPVFGNAPGDEAVSAEQDAAGVEDAFAPGPESAAKTATPDSEDEPFDFNFDSGTIARQVDRLDAFLSEDPSDEPEVASLPEDYTPREKAIQHDFAGGLNFEELSAITPGQIDKAIERVINEKFSGKIENIIYEVIEKAVAKEIDRLKGVLLDNAPPDDNI